MDSQENRNVVQYLSAFSIIFIHTLVFVFVSYPYIRMPAYSFVAVLFFSYVNKRCKSVTKEKVDIVGKKASFFCTGADAGEGKRKRTS